MQKPLRVRRATVQDLPVIVGMLADDPLGAQRENLADPQPPSYLAVFETIGDMQTMNL